MRGAPDDAGDLGPTGRAGEGVWTSTKIWADSELLYDAEVGDFWPGHPGNEMVVGGESNWSTMIYGHEDSWEVVRLVEEAWYVTNLAIGDVDPDEPGNEIVNVGWHGNISMVYWEDSTSTWKWTELVNGIEAGLDWGYGVAIGDFDPRYEGNEVAATDDLGHLTLVRKEGGQWVHEVIWKEGGSGIIDPYLDTVLLDDFDPDHEGDEILVTGGSKWLTEIYHNGSGWMVERLHRTRSAPVQLDIGDVLPEEEGKEIAIVGLSNNLTVLHRGNGTWVDEHVFADHDVIYDVDISEPVPGGGTRIVTGGWSSNVTLHTPEAQGAWDSQVLSGFDDFIFGVTVADFDDLHSGNEVAVTDRAGRITKIQYETPDFVLHSPDKEVTVGAGMEAAFDLVVYSRAGFDETVDLGTEEVPQGWEVEFRPTTVVPPGRSELIIDVPAETAPGTFDITVVGTAGGRVHTIDLRLRVLPPEEKDFLLKVMPASQSVVADYSATYTVVVEPVNGFSDRVDLEVSGLPDGASSTLSSDSVTPPDSVDLEVRTVATTPLGEHYITVSAVGGGKDHVRTVSLVVKDADSPDFTVGLAPERVDAVGSRPVEITVNVISLFGFSDPVSVSVVDAPAGMSVLLEPAEVVPTGTAVLNLTAEASMRSGTYYLQVTGTSGGLVHGSTLRVDLNPMGKPDFGIQVFPASVSLNATETTFFNVSILPENDFGARVDLSAQGLPPDSTVGFEPGSIGPFDTSTMSLRTRVTTAPGSYDMSIVATGSGLTRQVQVEVVVEPARPLLNLLRMEYPTDGVTSGEEMDFSVWMENLGPVNATSVTVELLVDGRVEDVKETAVSKAGAEILDLEWTATEGEHNVTARIVPAPGIDIIRGSVSKELTVHGGLSLVGEGGLLLTLIVVVIAVLAITGYLLLRSRRRSEEVEGALEGVEGDLEGDDDWEKERVGARPEDQRDDKEKSGGV